MSARATAVARNAPADGAREQAWRGARDALWSLLDRHVRPGSRVAVAGAGHAHDLPLTRLLARAGSVDLVDLDASSARRALRREPSGLRRRGRAVRADVTGGAADAIVRAALRGGEPRRAQAPARPLGRGRYDVVLGDLLYTQLLYPPLCDAGLPPERVDRALVRFGQDLVESVVARLHASAPGGTVIHVHDALAWWPGHEQAAGLDELLARAADDPHAALRRLAQLDGPWGCDVARAVRRLRADVLDLALWHWPFAPGVDYLVYGLVATA